MNTPRYRVIERHTDRTEHLLKTFDGIEQLGRDMENDDQKDADAFGSVNPLYSWLICFHTLQ